MDKFLPENKKSLLILAETLKSGGLAIFPTETVYGLAADATNLQAIEHIYEAKQRDLSKPLSIFIGHINQLNNWTEALSVKALELADAFWPGPLTLILKKKPSVPDIITAGKPNIGIRIPDHSFCLALLKHFPNGLVVTSANLAGEPTPRSAAQLDPQLINKVEWVIKSDSPLKEAASTIVDCSDENTIKILREGALTKSIREMI